MEHERVKKRKATVPSRRQGKDAVMEHNLGDAPLGQKKVEGRPRQRFLISIESVRKILLDEDNLCGKFHCDLCRYSSGGSFGDEPATTKIETSQRKVEKGQEEETIIEIYELV